MATATEKTKTTTAKRKAPPTATGEKRTVNPPKWYALVTIKPAGEAAAAGNGETTHYNGMHVIEGARKTDLRAQLTGTDVTVHYIFRGKMINFAEKRRVEFLM